ncbi:MAG: type-F conjugative transfer system secretin TraK [Ahniella sp.]|nr:type-F conjugative transfer system secretin TraK [Ahniella sp.]
MNLKWCLLLISPSLWAADLSPPSLPIRALEPNQTTEPTPNPDVLALADIERLVAAERTRLGTLPQVSPVGPAAESPAPALPPGQIAVTEGVTLAFPVGMGQINRIRTPFREFRVLHQSTATVKKQGHSLYVTPLDGQPFAVYVEDKDPPHRTIGVLLRPHGSLPPVQVQLTLSGTPTSTTTQSAGPVETHFARLRQTLRTVAQGLVPQGFFERMPRSDDPEFGCAIPGFRMQPDRVVEGSELLVLITHVTNQSIETLEIDESVCVAPGLLAVATFPDAVVAAGGHTTLMQVYRHERVRSVVSTGAP